MTLARWEVSRAADRGRGRGGLGPLRGRVRRADGGADGRGGGCGRRSGRRWRLRLGEASTATGNEGGGCETRRRRVPGGRGEGKSGKEEEGWRRLGGSPERVVEGEIGNDGPGRRKGGEIVGRRLFGSGGWEVRWRGRWRWSWRWR